MRWALTEDRRRDAVAIGSGHTKELATRSGHSNVVTGFNSKNAITAWAAITSFAARPSLTSHQKSHNVH